jgi:cell division septal protein FtsQ
VLALPSRPAVPDIPFARLIPSGRSLAICFAALAAVIGAYVAARGTSLFAVHAIEVTGARPSVVQRVDAALRPIDGTSLLSLDAATIDRRLTPLRDVSLVSYDRAFPHTAKIVVSAERPVAVLRKGSQAWIVTERGRVLDHLTDATTSDLPRIWVADVSVPSTGDVLTADEARRPTLVLGAALSADRTLFADIREARDTEDGVVLVLRSGTEIRLGDADEVGLQLAVAQHVLQAVGPGAAYVDVSVPERAVVG